MYNYITTTHVKMERDNIRLLLYQTAEDKEYDEVYDVEGSPMIHHIKQICAVNDTMLWQARIAKYTDVTCRGSINELYEIMETNETPFKSNQFEEYAIKKGHIHMLKMMHAIEMRYTRSVYITQISCAYGHKHIIEYLYNMHIFDLRLGFTHVMRYSMFNVVKYVTQLMMEFRSALLPASYLDHVVSFAINEAGIYGNDKAVIYLLSVFQSHRIDPTLLELNSWTTSADVTYQVMIYYGYQQHLLLRPTTIDILDAGYPVQNMIAIICIRERAIFTKRLKRTLNKYNIHDWDNKNMVPLITQYISYNDFVGIGKVKLNKKHRNKLKRKYNTVNLSTRDMMRNI